MTNYMIYAAGFSSFEKSTIESFFRLAARRAPYWTITDRLENATVVLLSAATQQDIDSYSPLIASTQQVVIVGHSDFDTGWALLQRPLKLTSILATLDSFAQGSSSTPATPATSSAGHAATSLPSSGMPPPASSPATDVMAGAAAPLTMQLVKARESAASPSSVASMLRPVGSNPPMPVTGRVLLVDDSDVALKFMQNRLRHFGYESHLVRSGEEALAAVASHDFQFVFLDVMMVGLDGYQTCRAIKQNKTRKGPPPVVVMLTSRGGTIDKIRGSMAGCDAYLTKPLNEKQLASILAKHDSTTISERWAADNVRQPLVDTYKARSL